MQIRNYLNQHFGLLIVFFLVNFFCFTVYSHANENKPQIFVVNYPLKYFASSIGAGLVDVHFPAADDVDPAFWMPSREIIGEYQKADLIFVNGAGYAKWLNVVSLPKSKIVNTSEGFKDRYIKITGSATHSHGPKGKHSHTGFAFTTWLDPLLAIEQAEAIKSALQELLPEKKNELQANFENLKKELLEIDRQLASTFSKSPGNPLLASHPVYQYLSARYDLNLISLHLEPDEVPDRIQLAQIRDLSNKAGYSWMIWEDSPLDQSVEMLDSMGINSLVFNPSGNTPKEGNYLSVMQLNIENLKAAYN